MYEIPRHTYRNRRNTGYTHEEALAYPSRVRYLEKIELPDGRWFPNLRELSNATGIKVTTLRYRQRQGYTGKDLIAEEGQLPTQHARVVLGIPFASDKDAAAHFGINYNTYIRRLAADWTVEQALELAPSPKAASLTVDGIPYDSVQALADAYGKPYDTVRRRIKDGMDPKDAITKPIQHQAKRQKG